jgi:hypothetical protein
VASTTTFAAWVGIVIIWHFDVGFEIVVDASRKHLSLIGSGTVNNILNPPVQPSPTIYDYSSDFNGTIPTAATAETLGVAWPAPAAGVTLDGTPVVKIKRKSDGAVFTESQFNAMNNGLTLVTATPIATSTSRVVQLIGSSADRYKAISDQYSLILEVTATGGNPYPDQSVLKFTGAYHVPTPIAAMPVVPPSPSSGATVTVTASADSALLAQAAGSVSFYRYLDSDPQKRAVLIGQAPLTGQGTQWTATLPLDLTKTFPTGYHIYAVVNDGFNAPVQSADSAAFTPRFAVYGSVSNQADEPQTGWEVFLDYNNNGTRDPGEPATTTNNQGLYSFGPDPSGFKPVPVGAQFDVQLVDLSSHFVIATNPQPVTYVGMDPLDAHFEAEERSTIRGTIYEDLNQSGKKTGQPTLAGWTVFIDLKSDRKLDPGDPTTVTNASGVYSFVDLQPGTYLILVNPQPGYFQESPSTDLVVTIDNTGFDLKIDQDFGVLPFSTVSGNVSAYLRGQPGGLNPNPSPVGNWEVDLRSGAQIVATTRSAADGSYSFQAKPGNYSISALPPTGYCSVSAQVAQGLG